MNGSPHGEGELIDFNGIEFKGRFQNGKRIKGQIKSGYGIIRGQYDLDDEEGEAYYEWKDGHKFYIGNIKNNRLEGLGKVYH